MKKIIIILVGIVALTSCKKVFVCCGINGTQNGQAHALNKAQAAKICFPAKVCE